MSDDLRALIRAIPDFPEPGVLYRDITPLLAYGPAFREVIDRLVVLYGDAKIDVVVGVESRGFLFAGALAERLGIGLVPVRKEGKLPHHRLSEEYTLEYGSSVLEIHQDAFRHGQRAVIVDDLLATGGTAVAAAKLVELANGEVHALAFLIELSELGGRGKLHHYRIDSLITF